MKKILTLLFIVTILIGCHQKKVKKADVIGIQEVTYQSLQDLRKKDEQFLLYIGRPDCGDCQQFEPLLQKYIHSHKNTGIYYLNIKSFRDNANKKNASEEEKSFYQNLRKELDFDWTPTIEHISSGKLVNKYTYLDEDYYLIQDRSKQIQARKDFESQFEEFMNSYYK